MNNPISKIEINQSNLRIIQGDITEQVTEAIVNAANKSLMGGGGVDGAIHHAGGPTILEECKQIVAKQGQLPTGKAVITSGGNLKAKYVIHTVGPIWQGGNQGEPESLASAYSESLDTAEINGITSISFPSISTGAYGYPMAEAAEIAVKTITDYLEKSKIIKDVVIVLFDFKAYSIYTTVLEQDIRKN